MGGRDHTTVLHARNKIEKLIAAGDVWIAAQVEAVIRIALKLDPSLDPKNDAEVWA